MIDPEAEEAQLQFQQDLEEDQKKQQQDLEEDQKRQQMEIERMKNLLKLHLKSVHIEHNEFDFEKMSPFVVIKIGDFEWRSSIKKHEGPKPEWHHEIMEHKVFDRDAVMKIEVRNNEVEFQPAAGLCECRVDFFAVAEGREEWLELQFMDQFAGRIHFKSEFFPEM